MSLYQPPVDASGPRRCRPFAFWPRFDYYTSCRLPATGHGYAWAVLPKRKLRMSTSDPEGLLHARRTKPLSISYLAWFCLPLALTFLMMSGAAPLVSNGITWMHGARGERIHLSAFLMSFATCIMIYSPMFVARNVAIRTITCRRSMARPRHHWPRRGHHVQLPSYFALAGGEFPLPAA